MRYGGFLYSKIQTDIKNGIIDANSFLFTFKNNNPMKFNLKKLHKSKSVFNLNTDENREELFTFGKDEICIKQKEFLSYCNNSENSYYNLKEKIDSLTDFENKKFTIKRIVVIRFD